MAIEEISKNKTEITHLVGVNVTSGYTKCVMVTKHWCILNNEIKAEVILSFNGGKHNASQALKALYLSEEGASQWLGRLESNIFTADVKTLVCAQKGFSLD